MTLLRMYVTDMQQGLLNKRATICSKMFEHLTVYSINLCSRFCIVYTGASNDTSEHEAKTLFVAYSTIGEECSGFLHQVASKKANVSACHEADGGRIAVLSVGPLYLLYRKKLHTVTYAV